MRQMVSRAERPNRAVILAGGKGTRLHPITEQIPKPMVTVAGRPILERLILHLVSCGLTRFSISINYLGHLIEQHFGDGSRLGCEIEYLRETVPLGTGGPLSLLRPPTLPVLVLNGDLVTQADVGDLLDFHERGWLRGHPRGSSLPRRSTVRRRGGRGRPPLVPSREADRAAR